MSRVTADGFAAAVNKILEDYKDGIVQNSDAVVKKIAQKGAKEVQAASGVIGGTGKYAKGWAATLEKGILSSTGIIYNKTPGLPHLLENGHAKRNGGRVGGRSHIAPAEETIIEEFTKAMEEII